MTVASASPAVASCPTVPRRSAAPLTSKAALVWRPGRRCRRRSARPPCRHRGELGNFGGTGRGDSLWGASRRKRDDDGQRQHTETAVTASPSHPHAQAHHDDDPVDAAQKCMGACCRSTPSRCQDGGPFDVRCHCWLLYRRRLRTKIPAPVNDVAVYRVINPVSEYATGLCVCVCGGSAQLRNRMIG